jgi:hypothetical protein
MGRKKSHGFSFSWKRAIGISGVRQNFARKTGMPTTKQGLERKVGASIIGIISSILFDKKK